MSTFCCDMRPSNKETPHEYAVSLSKEIYSMVGLKDTIDYEIYNISLKTTQNFICTFEGGFDSTNPEKPILVMIHGFMASTTFFFKMFPDLIKQFHVLAIDLPGFGTSSRFNQNEFKTTEKLIEFYTTCIEEWRQQMELNDNFYILGHSMGGFLVNHYLNIYKPQNISGVFMMSPAGITEYTEDSEKQFQKMGWIRKKMFGMVKYFVFKKKWKPMSLLWFYPTNIFIKKFLKAERLRLDEKESNCMIKYYKSVFNLGMENTNVQGYLLYFNKYSKSPVSDFVDELICKYKYYFFFGDKDWMDVNAVEKMLNKIPIDNRYEGLVKVNDCGHQMPFENPLGTFEAILEGYKKFMIGDHFDILDEGFINKNQININKNQANK